MTAREKVEWLVDDIVNNSIIQKYRAKHVWISGCSTEVHPITIYKSSIDIQLDSIVNNKKGDAFDQQHYDILEKCMSALADKHKDVISYTVLRANDDSCPSEMRFVFNKYAEERN